ncbi:MAG: DUF4974 domain-containing protein [Bacteroidetes bacterium]|nr:DUF4974 domain-containing protein [Bacteroidota bacterium]
METHEASYYDLLITKYYSGEASLAEQDELTGWIERDQEHRSRFEAMGKTHDLLMKQDLEQTIDLDEEWQHFSKKAGIAEESEKRLIRLLWPEKLFTLSHVARLAAAIILLLIPTYLIISFLSGTKYQTVVASQGIREVTLPDGSVVILNKGASIQYPVKFNKKEREILANGEMHFSVAHQAHRVFVVSAGDVKVSVLGTAFFLQASEQGTEARVVLEKGKVAVSFNDQPTRQTILSPGEEAIISRTGKTITRQINDDPNYMAWQTGLIIFDNTSLDVVAKTLAFAYGKEVVIANPAIAVCSITASFDNQTLESILKVIETTLDVKVSTTGEKIIISGEGCLKQ